MRILHLGKYYAPYHGGMETVLQNQAEGLLEAGASVRVLVAGEENIDTREHLAASYSGSKGNLIRAGRWGQWQSQPMTLNLFSLLRRQINEFSPDLVQIHLPNPLAVGVWLMMSRTQAMPPLALWHHADITRQKWGAKILRPMMDLCRQQARGIAVSTATLKENSGELSDVGSKVQVVPFGIKDPWPGGNPHTPGTPFLFIGRLVPYKGLDILLEALARVPQSQLDIVGTGPLHDHLVRKIHSLNLDARVRLKGALSQEDLNNLLTHCRALVLPSVDSSETFGLVQLEAMAAGKPIIASDLPSGVAEVNRHEETGLLVPPGNVDSLVSALARCLADDDLVLDWGRQSRQLFLAEYTRSHMTERLLDWYKTMTNPVQKS